MTRRGPVRNARGISLLEVLLAVTLLSLVLLGLIAASGVAVRQLQEARTDTHLWSAVQRQLESLVMAGYDSLTADSAVVDGYSMHWTVTGVDPKKLLFRVESTPPFGAAEEDTVVLYLTDPGL